MMLPPMVASLVSLIASGLVFSACRASATKEEVAEPPSEAVQEVIHF